MKPLVAPDLHTLRPLTIILTATFTTLNTIVWENLNKYWNHDPWKKKDEKYKCHTQGLRTASDITLNSCIICFFEAPATLALMFRTASMNRCYVAVFLSYDLELWSMNTVGLWLLKYYEWWVWVWWWELNVHWIVKKAMNIKKNVCKNMCLKKTLHIKKMKRMYRSDYFKFMVHNLWGTLCIHHFKLFRKCQEMRSTDS